MSNDQFVVELLREPEDRPIDWEPVADALVLLRANQEIVMALDVAQEVNAMRLTKQSRRRVIETVANDLRAQLAHLEEQLRLVA